MRPNRSICGLGLATLLVLVSTPVDAQWFRLKEHKFQDQGYARSYLSYTPKRASKLAGERPLVLLIHGGGGTHRGMVGLTRRAMNKLADQHGFYVVYPNAIGGMWNFGEGNVSRELKHQVDDLAYFNRVIDDAIARLPIDASRIFATGHSRGGQASYFVGCRTSRIRAIAPVSMPIPVFFEDDCEAGPALPIALLNGTEDPQVPYAGGTIKVLQLDRDNVVSTDRTLEIFAQRNGCPVAADAQGRIDEHGDKTSVDRFDWTTCSGAPMRLYRVNNGGHTWPSGRQYLGVRLIGEVSHDIDGAGEVWDFFSQFQSLPVTTTTSPESAPLQTAEVVIHRPDLERIATVDCRETYKEVRRLQGPFADRAALMEAAARLAMDDELAATFRGVRIESGTAILAFTADSMPMLQTPACQQAATKAPLEKTLKEFDEVLQVEYEVDGMIIREWDA